MKQRYLFLLRFLGLSLVLFIFRHQILSLYTSGLRFFLSLLSPGYRVPPDLGGFIYSSSLTMIAFVALVLATPIIPAGKRAGFLVIGIIIFLSVDWLGVQFMMFPQGRPPLDQDSLFRELYLSSKWILPFVLWLTMSYADLRELLGTEDKISPASTGDRTAAH